MRFATYNMLGGMNGDSLISNFLTHYYLYWRESFPIIRKRSKDFAKVLSLIQEVDADVVCLNEVLFSLQNEKLKEKLNGLGYQGFVLGKSPTRKKKLGLCTILASKEKAVKINFFMPSEVGPLGEANSCSLFIRSKNLVVLGVHLSLLHRLRAKQIECISKFVIKNEKRGRRVVVMGDFNETKQKLYEYLSFSKLDLKCNDASTFPNIWALKVFLRDYDHIFYQDKYFVKNSFVKKGISDHFMLVSDIVKKN